MENSQRVKINILTGFFGSGKTTLITHIIRSEQFSNKIAVIQNEFSQEIGIEQEILTDSQGQLLGNLYELPNGCLCCAVKDNTILFIENLIKKKDAIELVIVEAHGMSDIASLVKRFWIDQELESPLYLNSIICVVDCFNFNKNKDLNFDVLTSQIISSDKIILNKLDLIEFDSEQIEGIKQFMQSINPFGKIIESVHAKIEIEDFLQQLSISNPCSSEEVNHEEIATSHTHFHTEIDSIVVEIKLKTKYDVDKAIGNILWNIAEKNHFEVIRFKGILYCESEKFSIQGIYDLYDIKELHNNIQNDVQVSKILFIGKNLTENKALIENALT